MHCGEDIRQSNVQASAKPGDCRQDDQLPENAQDLPVFACRQTHRGDDDIRAATREQLRQAPGEHRSSRIGDIHEREVIAYRRWCCPEFGGVEWQYGKKSHTDKQYDKATQEQVQQLSILHASILSFCVMWACGQLRAEDYL